MSFFVVIFHYLKKKVKSRDFPGWRPILSHNHGILKSFRNIKPQLVYVRDCNFNYAKFRLIKNYHIEVCKCKVENLCSQIELCCCEITFYSCQITFYSYLIKLYNLTTFSFAGAKMNLLRAKFSVICSRYMFDFMFLLNRDWKDIEDVMQSKARYV